METEHYWKPSSDKVQLYHQLHMKKYREINHKQIQLVYTSHDLCPVIISVHIGSQNIWVLVSLGRCAKDSGILAVAVLRWPSRWPRIR